NNLKELEHVPLQHPLISTENGDEKLKDAAKCFGCWEPLANERLSCKICQVTRRRGFVYGCSPCKFVVHIECVSESLDLVIEDKRHEHPFTLLLRGSSFICDACGIEGSYASYICCTCNIMVHKKCTSLPRIIKSKWHDHRLFHKYFLRIEDFRVLDCIMCNYEVSTDYGSYYCSECGVIFHVKCAMRNRNSYEIVENEDEESADVSSIKPRLLNGMMLEKPL
ncbi:hypothetical protein Gogos_011240, partial [Gossypium gossypioides]|nr:hypothetical protein [Gossypium gossypioides]